VFLWAKFVEQFGDSWFAEVGRAVLGKVLFIGVFGVFVFEGSLFLWNFVEALDILLVLGRFLRFYWKSCAFRGF
jgi:hypothetical protein